MKPSTPATIGLVAVTLLGAGLWVSRQPEDATASVPATTAAATAEAEQRELEIAFWDQRAREDRFSANARARLAYLLLQRARATGSHDDIVRAEQAARESLELRAAHNADTYLTLASSLLAQHRFSEARDAAQRLFEAEPDKPLHRAVLGEAQMELGDYAAAGTVFGSLEPARKNLDVTSRLARWLEISGRPDEARVLLRDALDEAVARGELPREQVAWFHLRLGDHELRHGRVREAERIFRAGLELNPTDHRLLAAMARLYAIRHRWTKAIEVGDAAIAAVLDPGTLDVLGQAHAAQGDSAKAQEYFTVMEIAATSPEEPLHRAWALSLLDRGRKVPEVLTRAQEEIQTRKDVYGYDLLAWALHRQGRHAEAKQAMTSALRMGTQDASLFFHAGMIERALGNNQLARQHLKKALEINPYFHPTHPALVRAALKSLPRGG